MREAVKDAIIGIQGAGDGKSTRPPEAAGRKGVWKGHPNNAGAFKPGHDPRRHMNGPLDGAKQKTIERMATEHAETAVGTILEIMGDESSPAQTRLAAAAEMLNRGFGKSVDRSVQVTLDQHGNTPTKQLTRDEIMERLSQKFEAEVSANVSNVIEHRTDTSDTPHYTCDGPDSEVISGD